MKNWKTSLGGFLSAAGMGMQASEDGTTKAIGAVLGGIGLLLMGMSAKDKNVTGGSTRQ